MLVIKDPITVKYYQFGALEIALFRLLDGSTPPPKIIEQINAQHPDAEMTMDELKEFLGEIDKMKLLEKGAADRNALLLERLKEERKGKLMSKKGSVMFKRFPLVDPNDFFDRIHPYIKWIWSVPFVAFMCLVILAACVAIGYNWQEFLDGIAAIFSFSEQTASSLLWLWLTIICVIAFHELGHGLTCKHYGGEVHEMGFLVLFFQPCFYANVTDAYMFANKKHKLYVTFAGIIVEFFIGSLFCFVWLLTDPTSGLNAICYQAMTVCGISSVLFNLNPLVKYDGYYAFSEMVDLPNLKQNSGDALEKFLTRIYKKRDDIEEDDFTPRERRIYIIYSICATLFIVSMLAGILYLIKDPILEFFPLYPEAGAAVFIFICLKLLSGQISATTKFFKDFYLYEEAAYGGVKTRLAAGALLIAVIAACFTAPYDIVIEKEIKVESRDRWTVRAPVDGFLEEVYIRGGEEVKMDQPLFLMTNPDKSRRLADLAAEDRKFDMQRDQAVADGELGSLQDIQLRESQSSREREAIRREMQKLKTVSPATGLVLTPAVEELAGKYFNAGDKIMEIACLANLYSVVELEEREAGEVRDRRQMSRLRAEGKPAERATSARVKLGALPGRLFSGHIEAIDAVADTSGVTRKFTARIAIPNPDLRYGENWLASGLALRPGMTGMAKIDVRRSTPAAAIARWFAGFFRLDLFMY
ncbi:efflux RND transporter periplasmic adaptor subunit [bacterium]|nr:efflux RND transporter periplasmic adaptor subunit [bacterium]